MASLVYLIITLVVIPALGFAYIGWTETETGDSRIVNAILGFWFWVGCVGTIVGSVLSIPDNIPSGWLLLLITVVVPALTFTVASLPYGIVALYRKRGAVVRVDYIHYKNEYYPTQYLHERCIDKYAERHGLIAAQMNKHFTGDKCGYCSK